MAIFTEKTFNKCLSMVLSGEITAILFTGKNFGLSIELSNKIIQAFNPDEKITLDYTDDAKESPFIAELQSNLQDGFFSSKKVIKVFNIKSKKGISRSLYFLNNDEIKDKIVIFFGDEIDGKSELKHFFDKGEKTACVSLYEDDERTANECVKEIFANKKINIANDAIDKIANLLHGDRGVLISECEKLELYCKDKQEITINDVLIAVNDVVETNLANFVDNVLAGNAIKTVQEFDKLTEESGSLILISRMIIKIATNILLMKKSIENGESVEQVIKSNFIFYKRIPLVKQILSRTTTQAIENYIKNTIQIEKFTKIYGEKIAKQIFIKAIILSNIREKM